MESTEWPPCGPPAMQWDVDCGASRNDEAVGGRGWGAGGVVMGEARGRGGARPRVGRYLDGRMHLVGGLWPPARQREEMAALTPGPSPPCGEGWIPAFAGLCVPGSVGKRSTVVGGGSVGVRVDQGAGIGRGRGARPPGATGAGRPAQVRWRWVRHSDGADPAPRPWWPGVRQHPVPAIPHSDGHAPPHAGWRGVGHDPVRVRRHSDSTDPAPRP